MTDFDTTTEAISPKNTVWLYEQPELLTLEVHGRLGLSGSDRPFEFAKHARWMPLTVAEMVSAQKHYPVVFTELENPRPIAILGVFADRNLFVDAGGQWDAFSYVPAYLRCYPLTLAAAGNDKLAVVVDRAAGVVSDEPEHPFFENGKLSEHTQGLVDFCNRYDQEKQRTGLFCQRLKELGLLSLKTASYTAEGTDAPQPLATYAAVDAEKLDSLDKDTLAELRSDGGLAAIFAHLFSLENWRQLVGRYGALPGTAQPGNGDA